MHFLVASSKLNPIIKRFPLFIHYMIINIIHTLMQLFVAYKR